MPQPSFYDIRMLKNLAFSFCMSDKGIPNFSAQDKIMQLISCLCVIRVFIFAETIMQISSNIESPTSLKSIVFFVFFFTGGSIVIIF